jgi:hypothetical protein
MRKKKDAIVQQTQWRIQALQWVHEHMVEVLQRIQPMKSILSSLQKEPIDNLPNLLFYGASHFPLEYMAYALLNVQIPIKRKHLWEEKLPYYECESFFEIQCNHPSMPKNYDILCDFMKHILTSQCIHHNKHIMILRDVDIITQSEYHFALRVLLERFSHNVLFIATTHHISKLETPLISRFMIIRIPQPSMEDIYAIGKWLAPTIDPSSYVRERNLLATMFRLYLRTQGHDLELLLEDKDLEQFLSKTRSFEEVRQFAYRTFQKGVPFAEFCSHLITYVKPSKHQSTLVRELSSLEHSLALSSKGREPIYYEKALWITLYANNIWKSLVK